MKIGHSRPHALAEEFPPAEWTLAPWCTVTDRYWEIVTTPRILGMPVIVAPGMPTGVGYLVPSEEIRQAADTFMDQVRQNMAAWDALPAGTMVECHLPGCGPHPVEMYR